MERKKRDAFTQEEKVMIAIQYEQGMTAEELSKQWDAHQWTLYALLNRPDVKKIRRQYRETTTDRLFQSMTRNEDKIDDVMDSYIDEARKKSRIADTELHNLFKVFNTLVQSKIKLKELTLKEQELELKKQVVDSGQKVEDTGLIKDFLQVLDSKSTMKNASDNKEAIDYKSELEDDMDEDVKARTKKAQKQKTNKNKRNLISVERVRQKQKEKRDKNRLERKKK